MENLHLLMFLACCTFTLPGKIITGIHRVSSQGMSWLEMGMQPGTVLTIVVVEGEEGMGCQAAD